MARTNRSRGQRWILSGGGILLLALASWMAISQYVQGGFDRDQTINSQIAFEEATGVRLVFIAVAAGGGMINLRYQVLDPDKAVIVHDDDNPPTIIDEASGIALSRPWMDHDHTDELHIGVTYNDLLMNSGGFVKHGSLVTVVIGDARLEHVTVY